MCFRVSEIYHKASSMFPLMSLVTSLDGINGLVDSDVTEGVMTTRSNGMKFRLYIQYV